MLTEMRIEFTCDANGDVVADGDRSVLAKVVAVIYDRGDIDTNADIDISSVNGSLVTENILETTNLGTADLIIYPRRLVQNNAGGDLTGALGGDREMYFLNGTPRVTVDEGGNATSGAMTLIMEE
ncbi:hypothetical protein LCGC14_2440420 [marine sediment metagenome]|uniref:Uncharacterized protein n=1 Tax=marine sediment metagenome TaxID=412755 RepID=A0A0F9BJ66_9ZZZZ